MHAPAPKEFSPRELVPFRELVRRRSGLAFGESRVRSLLRGLSERMARLEVASLEDYYARVAAAPDGGAEWERLLEALLNKESSFFRHPPSFEALRAYLGGAAAARPSAAAGRPLALWSAGCSTGQEAYSVAMTALAALDPRHTPFTVLGTDLSAAALEVARAGRYRLRVGEAIPARCERYLSCERGAPEIRRVRDDVRALASFRPLNLVGPRPYPVGAMDVIFCQNVLIHLGPDERLAVLRGLVERLSPGGVLFLAPGEVPGFRAPGLEVLRFPDTLAYRRADALARETEPLACR